MGGGGGVHVPQLVQLSNVGLWLITTWKISPISSTGNWTRFLIHLTWARWLVEAESWANQRPRNNFSIAKFGVYVQGTAITFCGRCSVNQSFKFERCLFLCFVIWSCELREIKNNTRQFSRTIQQENWAGPVSRIIQQDNSTGQFSKKLNRIIQQDNSAGQFSCVIQQYNSEDNSARQFYRTIQQDNSG